MKKHIVQIFSVGLVVSGVASMAQAEWSIDLSRRTQQMRRKELDPSYEAGAGTRSDDRAPASVRNWDGDEVEAANRREVVASRPLDGSVDAAAGSTSHAKEPGFIDRVLEAGEPNQDIVILNTERGFVPNTIRVRKDGHYTVHVVNVNEKEKNISFILDGFSEHHATFYGKVKTFKLEPRKEGVYSFLSPETAVEGRFIVISNGPSASQIRAAASVTSGE